MKLPIDPRPSKQPHAVAADALHTLDRLAAIFAAVLGVALVAYPFTLGHIASTYADICGAEVPSATTVAGSLWATPAAGFATLLLTALAVELPDSEPLVARRGLVLLAAAVGATALGVAVVASCLLIYELAGSLSTYVP